MEHTADSIAEIVRDLTLKKPSLPASKFSFLQQCHGFNWAPESTIFDPVVAQLARFGGNSRSELAQEASLGFCPHASGQLAPQPIFPFLCHGPCVGCAQAQGTDQHRMGLDAQPHGERWSGPVPRESVRAGG